MNARRYRIEIANRQKGLRVPRRKLVEAVQAVLRGERIGSATISLAVVDDAAIRQLNRQYLDHDDATDVLSFLLDRSSVRLDGEVVMSAETAQRVAPDYGWSAQHELLLYAIHGVLHLAGYQDDSAEESAKMRAKERQYLAQLGYVEASNDR
jgi:probable rRNA maturation factor